MQSHETRVKLIQLEIEAKQKAVSLVDPIIGIMGKFDGKQANKRLDTALKGINEDLRFNMEYNSFKISMYIANRMINSQDHADYIKSDYVYLVHGSITSAYGNAIMPQGVIDSNEVNRQLYKFRTETIAWIEKLENQVKNIETILIEYKAVKDAMERFNNRIDYTIREYWQLDFKR